MVYYGLSLKLKLVCICIIFILFPKFAYTAFKYCFHFCNFNLQTRNALCNRPLKPYPYTFTVEEAVLQENILVHLKVVELKIFDPTQAFSCTENRASTKQWHR